MTFTPTQEQLDIIEAAKTGVNLRIQAYAGCSKTTTLVLTANELVKPSLYLAYNKAMAEEAKEKFPDHVEVRTTHSLAYSHIGKNYHHKLSRPRGAYRNVAGTGGEIARFFKIKDIELSENTKLSAAAIGLAVKLTVNSFEYSADEKLSLDNIPEWIIKDYSKRKGFIAKTFKTIVLKYAKMLWKERTDINSEVLCTHDTYMKLFQLTHPVLEGYDVIYGDEFQDVNACFLSIFENQQCQKIAVGDTFQSIYQWRGSVNAMESLTYEQKYLSTSFRFGQSVGDVATRILRDKYTGKCNQQVKGWENVTSIVTDEYDPEGKQHTILFRTNAALLSEAVMLLEQGYKLNIETDMSDFVKSLQSALALYQTDMKNVKHEDIIPFNTWQELKTEGKANGELVRLAKIVEDGEALRYIEVLERHYNTTSPDIILTTAHKSKGREWDIVLLADDFPSVYNDKGEFVGLDDQERNLVYVAATRAKKVLCYNSTVAEMLSTAETIRRNRGIQIGNISLTQLSAHTDVSEYFPTPRGEHALEAFLRAQDELNDLMETQYCREDQDFRLPSDDLTPKVYKKLVNTIRSQYGMSDYIDME